MAVSSASFSVANSQDSLSAETIFQSTPSPPTDIHLLSTLFYGHEAPSYAPERPLKQTLPPTSMPCVAPELVYPFGHSEYDATSAAAITPLPRTSGSPRRQPRARRTAQAASSPSPYPAITSNSSPRTSSHLVACTRRNAPVSPTNTPPSSASPRTKRWACPHCPYVQHNRRAPDFKRHLRTHTHGADLALWVCCGVCAPDAMEHGVPLEVIRQGEVIEFEGLPMIGGCRKTFSRRDALIRHLHRRKGKCFGDALSMYQPGNRLQD